ncbi:MAG: hypothetical protein IJ104_00750 [Methanobrevibacter sp.]|nr:hypothetical protein [Methanobrevibacter sp.]MBQ9024898.1 hypothetical protein [Methanobrevibacter sp.]
MKESYNLNQIKKELQEVKQELRIQNMLTILKLTMRAFTRDEVVKMLTKIEENPDKKFSELVDEILMKWR